MTASDLARRMSRRPIHMDMEVADRIRVAFLLNLLGRCRADFTEAEILDARDALLMAESKFVVNELLGLPKAVEHAVDLAGPHDKTAMPMMENDPTLRRLVMFLRPDPKMVVEVEKKEVNTEPRLEVFQVCIEDGRGGSWMESFASEDTLRAFLRGIRVTYAMSDLLRLLPDFGDEAPFEFTEQSAVQQLP